MSIRFNKPFKNYKYLVFDLDGTLIASLDDIVSALNLSFKDVNHDYVVTFEEAKDYIGGGADRLIHLATKSAGLPSDLFPIFNERMAIHYAEEQLKTKAFNGEPEILKSLKEKGYQLFILSNKPDFLLKSVVEQNYGDGTFTYMMGKRSEFEPKPNPASFEFLIKEFGLNCDEILYVGDSYFDMEFARNTGVDVLLCAFGYEHYTEDLLEKADYVIDDVNDLKTLFLN